MNWEKEFQQKMMEQAGESEETLEKPEHTSRNWDLGSSALFEFSGILGEDPTKVNLEELMHRYLADVHEVPLRIKNLRNQWKCYESKGLIFIVRMDEKPKVISVVRGKYLDKIKEMVQRLEGRERDLPKKEFPIDMEKIHFTQHALEQFVERFPNMKDPTPQAAARKLLKDSAEDETIEERYRVERAIKNKFQPARYFRNGDCRFVLLEEKEGTYSVVTIEIPKKSRDID